MNSKTDISLVIPIFNEEGNIQKLHLLIKKALNSLGINFEIIYVNDGSFDRSQGILNEICTLDSSVRVINFKKNYGQDAAIAAGLEASQKDVVITMDADLQDDPEDIKAFLDKINGRFDIICGWRRFRAKRHILRDIEAFVGNKLGALIFGLSLHDFNATFKAYKRSAISNLYFFKGFHRFVPVLALIKNLEIGEVEIRNKARYSGCSKYYPCGVNRILAVLKGALLLKYSICFPNKNLEKLLPKLNYEIIENPEVIKASNKL